MKIPFLRKTGRSHAQRLDDANRIDIWDEVEGRDIKFADETRNVAGPTDIKLHAKTEFEHRARAQRPLQQARAEAAIRPFESSARRHAVAARTAERQLATIESAWENGQKRLQHALDALSAFDGRSPAAGVFYIAFLVLLVFGDVASGTLTLHFYGESIGWAAVLTTAVSAAVVAIGTTLGRVMKHADGARKRASVEITDELRPFAHLFSDQKGPRWVSTVLWCFGLVALIAVSSAYATLRTTTDSASAGAFFGLIAFAVGIGSIFNSYGYSDEISDLLDTYRTRGDEFGSKANQLARSEAIIEREHALSQIESIRREAEAVGEAATHEIHAALYRLLGENAVVAGTGDPVGTGSGPTPASERESDAGGPEVSPTQPFTPPPFSPPPSTNGHKESLGSGEDDER